MLGVVLDTFEKYPNSKYSHLDSQTVPITNYLGIRPEIEEKIRKYVSEAKNKWL